MSNRSKADIYEALKRAGYRWTFRDDLAEFWFDVKADPWFAFTLTALGFLFGMLAVAVPSIIIAWRVG